MNKQIVLLLIGLAASTAQAGPLDYLEGIYAESLDPGLVTITIDSAAYDQGASETNASALMEALYKSNAKFRRITSENSAYYLNNVQVRGIQTQTQSSFNCTFLDRNGKQARFEGQGGNGVCRMIAAKLHTAGLGIGHFSHDDTNFSASVDTLECRTLGFNGSHVICEISCVAICHN